SRRRIRSSAGRRKSLYQLDSGAVGITLGRRRDATRFGGVAEAVEGHTTAAACRDVERGIRV
ncbi:MAG: hypothetical protein R6V60_02250, partial [Desulfobacterales bacterium]